MITNFKSSQFALLHLLNPPSQDAGESFLDYSLWICKNYKMMIVYIFFYIYSLVNLVVFVRVLGTCYGKETSRFCQAQNFEASFFCTAHFITSACSFNIGLALLLGIRSLDPRPRARTAPALAWCRRQLGSQTSCSAKSRSQYWSLTFNDKHWNVWWNLAS